MYEMRIRSLLPFYCWCSETRATFPDCTALRLPEGQGCPPALTRPPGAAPYAVSLWRLADPPADISRITAEWPARHGFDACGDRGEKVQIVAARAGKGRGPQNPPAARDNEGRCHGMVGIGAIRVHGYSTPGASTVAVRGAAS